MTPLGWFHTIMGIIAIVSGAVALVKYREITLDRRSGQIYLGTTFVTAVTALMIYKHGGFGPAHGMAVLTLLALAVGTAASYDELFGRFSRYVRAIAYSGSLLFHGLPAVTDGLMRLPVGDPVVTSLDDPLMRTAHLTILALVLIGVTIQLRWISRQERQVGE